MPASIEGQLTAGYIATNTFIEKRDIRKRIFPRYNEHNLFDFMKFTERTKETDNTRFNWHEFGYLYGYGEVLSATGFNGAGLQGVVTLKAASHQEGGTKSSGKQWDLIMLNKVRGWVQTTDKTVNDAHTYTIKPIRATDNFGAVAGLANLVINFFSTAKSDGSAQPGSMVRKPDVFFNFCQIFATNETANGSVSSNRAEVEIKGKPYYYLQQEEDAANKHINDICFAFVLGEAGDASLLDSGNANEPVITTRGMEAYIRDFGNSSQWVTVDIAYLQGLEKILSRERAPAEMLMINGVNLDVLFDAFVKGQMDNSGISYAQFGKGDAKQRAVDFGFDSFRFSKHTYHKMCADFMNYTPVTGNAIVGQNSPYPDMGFIVPLDKMANPKPTGAQDDDYIDTLATRFKRNDRQNRYIKHWTRDITITNIDKIEFNYITEAGLQMARLNQAIRMFK